MRSGLSIEKLSFNAFNEGTRLAHCIKMHKRLFEVDVKKIGDDASYAGKTNRESCTSNGIHTSFVQKGKGSRRSGERTLCNRILQECGPQRWRDPSGRRRSTT